METLRDVSDIKKYSIHLMWVNKTLNPDQEYIAPAQDKNELLTKIFMPAIKWAEANPEAEVCFWYDGVHTTQSAVKKSHLVLEEALTQRKFSHIKLRDVREIPLVSQNADTFSQYLPVYFRVDLLKMIIITDSIVREGNDSAIFTDLEVGDKRIDQFRMGKDELFEPFIMEQLISHGLLLNSYEKNKTRIENQFIQLVRNPKMIEAIKHTVVNANLMRAITALNSEANLRSRLLANIIQAVYSSVIQHLHPYYWAISKDSCLQVKSNLVQEDSTSEWIDYHPEKHGYAPFGLYSEYHLPYVGDSTGKRLGRPSQFLNWAVDIDDFMAPARRDVDVREGKSHGDLAFYQAPASGGETYSCQLMQ